MNILPAERDEKLFEFLVEGNFKEKFG